MDRSSVPDGKAKRYVFIQSHKRFVNRPSKPPMEDWKRNSDTPATYAKRRGAAEAASARLVAFGHIAGAG